MESSGSCCQRRPPAALGWALLGCALLATLATLAALLLLSQTRSPDPQQPQSGARLVLDGPGKIMKPGQLEWHDDNRIDGVYLGPGFEYNSRSHMLKIKKSGLYFVYAQLSAYHVSRISSKKMGDATLTIHRKTAGGLDSLLTLPLHLSSCPNKTLAAFMAVSPRQLTEGDLLYATLTVSNTTAESRRRSTPWHFGDGTVFGLSPIDGNCNSEAAGIRGSSAAPEGVEWILKSLGKFFQSDA